MFFLQNFSPSVGPLTVDSRTLGSEEKKVALALVVLVIVVVEVVVVVVVVVVSPFFLLLQSLSCHFISAQSAF